MPRLYRINPFVLLIFLGTACLEIETLAPPAPVARNKAHESYTLGKKAQDAGEYEQAFNYYMEAYHAAAQREGFVKFTDPGKNNYIYSIKFLNQALDEVGKLITAPGDWRGPLTRQMADRQKEMLEQMMSTQTLFNKADELVKTDKYTEAIEIMDKIMKDYPFTGEAQRAKELKNQYATQLENLRAQLFNDAMIYFDRRDYPMAKEAFERLFAIYPATPEAAQVKAKIESYLKQIEQTTQIPAANPEAPAPLDTDSRK